MIKSKDASVKPLKYEDDMTLIGLIHGGANRSTCTQTGSGTDGTDGPLVQSEQHGAESAEDSGGDSGLHEDNP